MEEITVIPAEIETYLYADMRSGRPVDFFLTACRQYMKQKRREQMESVREFYRRLSEDGSTARLTPCGYNPVWLNADENDEIKWEIVDGKEGHWVTMSGVRLFLGRDGTIQLGDYAGMTPEQMIAAAKSTKKPFPTGALSGKDVAKFLKSEGFKFISQDGSHAKYYGPNGEVTHIPMHGKKSLKKGMLDGIKKQAGYK